MHYYYYVGCNKLEVPFTLSTFSNKSIEEVTGGCSEGLKWFQVQPMKNRLLTVELVQRAERCGFKAIVVTCDHPINPRGPDDKRKFDSLLLNNFSDELNEKFRGNIGKACEDFLDPSATWEWVDWLRSITRLPIVLKGIQRADDAREAISHDIQAIQVSNHGGRKLDGGAPTVSII